MLIVGVDNADSAIVNGRVPGLANLAKPPFGSQPMTPIFSFFPSGLTSLEWE